MVNAHTLTFIMEIDDQTKHAVKSNFRSIMCVMVVIDNLEIFKDQADAIKALQKKDLYWYCKLFIACAPFDWNDQESYTAHLHRISFIFRCNLPFYRGGFVINYSFLPKNLCVCVCMCVCVCVCVYPCYLTYIHTAFIIMVSIDSLIINIQYYLIVDLYYCCFYFYCISLNDYSLYYHFYHYFCSYNYLITIIIIIQFYYNPLISKNNIIYISFVVWLLLLVVFALLYKLLLFFLLVFSFQFCGYDFCCCLCNFYACQTCDCFTYSIICFMALKD